MKHYDYEINLFVDGELAETEKQELFAHLAECNECRNAISELLLLKEKSRLHIAESINGIKKAPKKINAFYKIGFYSSAAAAIILLILLAAGKPKETFVTKNEVRIDTVFVNKEIQIAQNKITEARSVTPGKRIVPVETSQKEYLRYVMSLRTIDFSNVVN
jgi:hypothetical protein